MPNRRLSVSQLSTNPGRSFRVLAVLWLALLSGCEPAADGSLFHTRASREQNSQPISEWPASNQAEPITVPLVDENAQSGVPNVVTLDSSSNDQQTPESSPQQPAIVPSNESSAGNETNTSGRPDMAASPDGTRPITPSATSPAEGSPASSKGKAAGELNLGVPLPGGPRVLIPSRQFPKVGPEGVIRISFDDLDLLKILNMEPVVPAATQMLPGWLRDLSGQRIRLRGFMYPTFAATGLEEFVLARDNEICCFVRQPKIYDVVHVNLRPGTTTRYIDNRPFDVVGKLKIELVADGEAVIALYSIEEAQVIEK
jgi:hypothetical protein